MSFALPKGAWHGSLSLKREVIDRVSTARTEGRIVSEPQCSWWPHRKGGLCSHVMDGAGSLEMLPLRAGLPVAFGRAHDALYRRLPSHKALNFCVDALEAIEPGTNVEPAVFAVAVEVLRRHRGANLPTIAEAIAGVIKLVRPFAREDYTEEVWPDVAHDAIAECEYARECIRRKKNRDPKLDWAWDASLCAESLARIIRTDKRDTKFADFWRCVDPRDVDGDIAKFFIAELKRRSDRDADGVDRLAPTALKPIHA